MDKDEIVKQIKKKESYLCIGLDTDLNKIPSHLHRYKDPIFEFNKQLIDSTHELCVAYKPNLAFYEALGPKGLESLHKTIEYIPNNILKIADAKRGDIGNTSYLYAKTFFDYFNFDALTISPYMGEDSVMPFFTYKNKWVILLALTSNVGSSDFQFLKSENNKLLYENVIDTSIKWASSNNLMFVIGATKAYLINSIRKSVPKHFLLIPGVGTQGGNLETVSREGLTDECGLIVNCSRSIIYASNKKNFPQESFKQALSIQQQMKSYIHKYMY